MPPLSRNRRGPLVLRGGRRRPERGKGKRGAQTYASLIRRTKPTEIGCQDRSRDRLAWYGAVWRIESTQAVGGRDGVQRSSRRLSSGRCRANRFIPQNE